MYHGVINERALVQYFGDKAVNHSRSAFRRSGRKGDRSSRLLVETWLSHLKHASNKRPVKTRYKTFLRSSSSNLHWFWEWIQVPLMSARHASSRTFKRRSYSKNETWNALLCTSPFELQRHTSADAYTTSKLPHKVGEFVCKCFGFAYRAYLFCIVCVPEFVCSVFCSALFSLKALLLQYLVLRLWHSLTKINSNPRMRQFYRWQLREGFFVFGSRQPARSFWGGRKLRVFLNGRFLTKFGRLLKV